MEKSVLPVPMKNYLLSIKIVTKFRLRTIIRIRMISKADYFVMMNNLVQ